MQPYGIELEVFTVSPQGTTMTNRVGGLIGSGTLNLSYANGLLYTSDGRIIDPLATNLVGILPVQSGNQLVAVHPAAGRLCYLRAVPQSPATLIVFDQMPIIYQMAAFIFYQMSVVVYQMVFYQMSSAFLPNDNGSLPNGNGVLPNVNRFFYLMTRIFT